jgi:tetratricopeptide (TPR) repeat protein
MKVLNCLLGLSLACSSSLLCADQHDPRLDELFEGLKAAKSTFDASVIEQQIWQIWVEHDDSATYQLMLTGIRYMNLNQPGAALDSFNRLIMLAPDYAEAWNKRATLHYLTGDYQASEADIAETLAREPFHFGAISGLGLVSLAQGKYEEARRAFQTLLEIHPTMPGVREQIQQIDDLLGTTLI